MKKIAYIIIPWAISLLFQGCAHDADSEMFDREPEFSVYSAYGMDE